MAQKKYQPGKEPGYKKKVYLKLAKRVHADLKKKGLKPKWNESQKFTSEYLYPKFKNELISNINFTKIDKALNIQLEKNKEAIEDKYKIVDIVSPEDEDCGSVFKVPVEDIISTEWWNIVDTVKKIPYNVKIRVNGGSDFGTTPIAKASDIDYNSDLSPIIENIRKFTNNGSGPSWVGVQKIVPGKKDDGKNCSYFIDFVLDADGVISDEFTQTFEKLSQEEIEERALNYKKIEKERIEYRKKIEEQKLITEKLNAAKNRKRGKEKPKADVYEITDKNILRSREIELRKDLDKLFEEYKLGIRTVKEYKEETKRINDLIEYIIRK